ncbi:hypothetical protein [Bartonella sp. CB60]|uniref:hypothetical protein n=1 Tax=Bartonella sp. CB60 TaxID=3113619 RepID=UPI00300DC9EE
MDTHTNNSVSSAGIETIEWRWKETLPNMDVKESVRDGTVLGRAIAEEFLALMQSGFLPRKNHALFVMLSTWDIIYKYSFEKTSRIFLEAQRHGFLYVYQRLLRKMRHLIC